VPGRGEMMGQRGAQLPAPITAVLREGEERSISSLLLRGCIHRIAAILAGGGRPVNPLRPNRRNGWEEGLPSRQAGGAGIKILLKTPWFPGRARRRREKNSRRSGDYRARGMSVQRKAAAATAARAARPRPPRGGKGRRRGAPRPEMFGLQGQGQAEGAFERCPEQGQQPGLERQQAVVRPAVSKADPARLQARRRVSLSPRRRGKNWKPRLRSTPPRHRRPRERAGAKNQPRERESSKGEVVAMRRVERRMTAASRRRTSQARWSPSWVKGPGPIPKGQRLAGREEELQERCQDEEEEKGAKAVQAVRRPVRESQWRRSTKVKSRQNSPAIRSRAPATRVPWCPRGGFGGRAGARGVPEQVSRPGKTAASQHGPIVAEECGIL